MKKKQGKKENRKYIVPERFKEIKEIMSPGVSNQDLADKFYVEWRTFQNYVNAKTRAPRWILEDLCSYYGVDPEWLCGESDYRKKRMQNADTGLKHFLTAKKLGDYLEARGIQDQSEGLPIRINGVLLSIGEYHAYMQEIEEVIWFTTEHYIKNLVAFRDAHMDTIEQTKSPEKTHSLPDPGRTD